MKRPEAHEYAPFYRGYVDLVPEEDVLGVLEGQPAFLRRLAGRVARDRELFAYAPGKWTIRQVLGHLGDGERVFGFRAFCFARACAAGVSAGRRPSGGSTTRDAWRLATPRSSQCGGGDCPPPIWPKGMLGRSKSKSSPS